SHTAADSGLAIAQRQLQATEAPARPLGGFAWLVEDDRWVMPVGTRLPIAFSSRPVEPPVPRPGATGVARAHSRHIGPVKELMVMAAQLQMPDRAWSVRAPALQ